MAKKKTKQINEKQKTKKKFETKQEFEELRKKKLCNN